MKTKSKFSAYILRGGTAALLFSCVVVAICSAINLPEQASKILIPQDNVAFGASRSLSFAERVAYQTAIEDVYWRHRIWPNTNPRPKPGLDAVMSQADIEKKVTGYLHNSQILEDDWQRPARNASHPPVAMQQVRAGSDASGPITADQLQAEMERMASNTKQPEVLQELFDALGNDPFVIAECLARPILAERLVAEFSGGARDASFRPKSRMERLGKPRHGREGRRLSEPDVSESNRAARLTANSTGSFDSAQDDIAADLHNVAYTLPVIAHPFGGCADDTWIRTTPNNAPSARYFHTAVWTGTEMIVWGGDDGPLNTGGRYSPSTDSWIATNTTNAPPARSNHTAVWTGSEMIVWGGTDGSSSFNTGGMYNPSTDTWTPTGMQNVPTARGGHTAVWTGGEMIIWGGSDGSQFFNTGGRYNPTTGWTPTSTANAPVARVYHTAVWTDNEMIIWGGWDGSSGFNTGGRYNPSTDSWTATTTANAPAGRIWHTAVWANTTSEMIIWAGDNGSLLNSGGRYNPGTDSWTATSLTNAPAVRAQLASVWTGSEMIVWGGRGVSMPAVPGGRYDPAADSWTATSSINAPPGRRYLTGVWTGSEMIVWGGQAFGVSLNTGGKYCAAAPSTTPTPTPSPTATATGTATATPTATATATPTATTTATATATPTASFTPRPAPTPRPRPTPAPRP
jgi:Kelch motif